jgi:hypothetical protein
VSLRFLLDTNILSEPLRPSPNPNVMIMLRQHENEIGNVSDYADFLELQVENWLYVNSGCDRLKKIPFNYLSPP